MKSIFAAIIAFAVSSATFLGALPAQGFIIYTDPPSPYVNEAEFASYANTNSAYATIVRTDGAPKQVWNSGVIGIVNYPTGLPDVTEATQALRSIQDLQRKCPQEEFRAYFQGANAKWQNALALSRQKQKQVAAAEKAQPGSNIATLSLEVNGTKYESVTLTGVDEDSASITHSAGVARILLTTLTKEKITALNKTSTTIKIQIRTDSDFLDGASARVQNPGQFVTFLAQDRHRFPLTSFCYALQSKNWDKARAIVTGQGDILALRLGQLGYIPAITNDDNKQIPVLLLTVAARAKNGDIADANKTCDNIEPLGWHALGMRIIEEWALSKGDLEKAKSECDLLTSGFNLPAERDSVKQGPSGEDGGFDSAGSAKVQRSAAFEEIVRALAKSGNIDEAALWAAKGNDRNDIEYLANIDASISKAQILVHVSQAREAANTFIDKIRPLDSTGYCRRLIYEAEAQGFARINDWQSADDALDSAMVSVTDNFTFAPNEAFPVKGRLFLEKALVYDRSGDVEKKERNLQLGLAAMDSDHITDWTERLQEVHLAIALDWKTAESRFDELRKALGTNSGKSVKDRIYDLIDFARWQREAENIEEARYALNDAALLRASDKDIGDQVGGSLAGEQAACGLVGDSLESLAMVRNVEQRKNSRKTIAVQQAKRQQITNALSVLKPEAYTIENIDLVGAAVIMGVSPVQPELDTSYKDLPF